MLVVLEGRSRMKHPELQWESPSTNWGLQYTLKLQKGGRMLPFRVIFKIIVKLVLRVKRK
jgi:hypothetical protein